MKLKFIGILILLFPNIVFSQLKHSEKTLYPDFKHLIMAGYQGWFRSQGDGSGSHHFVYGDDKRSGIDVWPDVSEYQKTYPTPFKYENGETAKFFSSYDRSTVDLHFKWMKEYGVDGVFMQRFFNSTHMPGHDLAACHILSSALSAASKYQRAIAVMYDLSGLKATGQDCSSIIEDWKYLVDSLQVTNQKNENTYVHFQGKPIVAIWGIGFPDRPYNLRNIGLEKLIDFLKNDPKYGHCAVMLGVPAFWRTLDADCVPDPYLHQLIQRCDILLPWNVQRYSPLLHNDMNRFRDRMIGDMQWCKVHHVAYVPCVYPGFSWHNLSRYEFPDDVKPLGSIPRQKGRFYWEQIATAINAGAGMLYVAMFDEVNEGTAIFKLTNHPPHGKHTSFLNMEDAPSDQYLWLTGMAAKMLRNEIPMTLKPPVRTVSKVIK